jgi:hypothetical protein
MTMPAQSDMQEELKSRVWKAMLSYAFFRIESALTIALILVLIFLLPRPFVGWQWWYWLILGLAAEGLIVYTSLTDHETRQRLLVELLKERYNPADLRNPKYRSRLEKAIDYHQRMAALVQATQEGVLKDRLKGMVEGMDAWIANMYRLSKRLDAYEADKVLARDMEAAPEAIRQLEKRLSTESNPAIRAQAQETLSSKRAQWENLQKLKAMMEKADLQLEETLSDLGNVYSQLRQIEVRDVDSGRAQRIADDINDQVATLQDIVDSMDEVYSAR